MATKISGSQSKNAASQRPVLGADDLSLLTMGTLPVRELATLAVREGRRPKPVYGTHKWFARRLGSAFRGLLVAAATPAGGDFWGAYEGGVDLAGTTLLDPFVGGGTSVIEAQRLGLTCHGTDVDPVAVAITSFQSRLQALPDLAPALRKLVQSVGKELAPFHRRADGSVALHHFWVQVVPCGGCGAEFDAHPHHVLAAEVGKKTRHVFCRHCGEVHETPGRWSSFTCHACNGRTKIEAGNVYYGKAACPDCGSTQRLIDLFDHTGRPPRFRLFACEVVPVRDGGRPVPMAERRLVKADAHDLALVDLAEAELERRLQDDAPGLPVRAIPVKNRSDNRPIRYGYRDYIDLFNPRQRLHLLLLSRAILRLKGPVREALAIAFSDHVKANCMLASYAVGYRRLSPLFSLRAFRHIPRPVELNPWTDGTGRGSFPNTIRQVSRAAASVRSNEEYCLTGGTKRAAIITPGSVDVRVESASLLAHVPDASVDIVLTDPPYFDNIAYSELADFFVPWQRHLGLIGGPERDGFPPGQLAAPARNAASASRFGRDLGACFRRIADTMKPGGIGAFTYQHNTAAGWITLATAMASAPLRVVKAFPLAGDTGASLHREQASICWDAVLIVRRDDEAVGASLRVAPETSAAAASEVARWMAELGDTPGVPFRAADAANLHRAFLVAAALAPRVDGAADLDDDLAALVNGVSAPRGRGLTAAAGGHDRSREIQTA